MGLTMKNKNVYWSSSCGRLCLIFRDREQVEEIAHSGDCEASTVEALPYFRDGLQFSAYTDQMIRDYLAETGIEREGVDGIDNMDRHTLEMYLLWIAAGDMLDVFNIGDDYGEDE
ncbi:hypothetical protein [Cronobacter phage EspYZU12]|nr:hypothetical protein EspYZU14_184 [Cronobacter phage EspYZU14]WBF78372.1 hypothetical protein [Cronobacter phage EspYZU12]